MSQLSIFIDESGDIGDFKAHSPYYIVTLVFHNQDDSVAEGIEKLNHEMAEMGFGDMAIHTEPLIRREEAYSNLSPNERRKIFSKLYFFAVKSPIRYRTIIIEKKQCADVFQLEARIARELSVFIRENLAEFQTHENILVYYDNGQRIVNRVLNTVLATELTRYEIRRVLPKDYRLFQVADLICTITLIKKKIETQELLRSEQYIFHSKRDFYKDFVKRLEKLSM